MSDPGLLRAVLALILTLSSCYGLAQKEPEWSKYIENAPPPEFGSVDVTTHSEYSPETKLYTYRHDFRNNETSTASVQDIYVDLTNKYPRGGWYARHDLPDDFEDRLTINTSENHAQTFAEARFPAAKVREALPPGHFVIPAGIELQGNWAGGLSVDGYASLADTDSDGVEPGAEVSGLEMTSPGVPVIKEMVLKSFWMPVFKSEPTRQMRDAVGDASPRYTTHALAPAGTAVLGWSSLRQEIEQARELGWIPDNKLAQRLREQFDAANDEVIGNRDGAAVRQRLRTLLETLAGAPPEAITPGARSLIQLNVEALIRVIEDDPVQSTRKFFIEPETSQRASGQQVELSGFVVDSVKYDVPVVDYPLRWSIRRGPNSGKLEDDNTMRTDNNGEVHLGYRGSGKGKDQVTLHRGQYDSGPPVSEAEVQWQGGPDLKATFVLPPRLRGGGGVRIQIGDEVQNLGDQKAPASTVHYYLTQSGSFDPEEAILIGKRKVPALAPGEEANSNQGRSTVTVPARVPRGRYRLVACADANDKIHENDETNNCTNQGGSSNVQTISPGMQRR